MVKKSEKERPSDPETEEKKRLRSLAISRKILGCTPANPAAPLPPSSGVVKLDGRDIVKRGQRKSRYLFSFPGLLAPLSGGRVGELANLGTRNPILYLEFPQGWMKLFGTHVFPKNKYLSLQLTRSSKGVMCEDCFDSMIVFSDAWWIGPKEENPDEHRLEFPKDLNEGKHEDGDFKGGAGAAFEEASHGKKPGKEYVEPFSPEVKLQDDVSGDSNPITGHDTNILTEATPVRQSARTLRKPLNYAEPSSGDDSISSDAEISEEIDVKVDVQSDNATRRSIFGETEDTTPVMASVATCDSEFVEAKIDVKGKLDSSFSLERSEENTEVKGKLVQATLSTLFEKVAEKKSKRSANDSPGPKGSSAKRQRLSTKQPSNQVQVKGSNSKIAQSNGRKVGKGTKFLQKKSKVEDNESEEISSESQDDSDEDWAA